MRGSGVLLHISSLPNPYGIGTLGKEAYEFIDFLKESGQKYWQVLPIGPTSYGDSPYQTFSAFAGNPYFVDFDKLELEGLLKKEEYQNLKSFDDYKVDYAYQYQNRFKILKLAYERFSIEANPKEFVDFQKANSFWLEDYSLFMAIKDSMPEGGWNTWTEKYKIRDTQALTDFAKYNQNVVEFWKFVQFKFFQQWDDLKKYANEHGIMIIGDMPIYVAYDSSDVWSMPKYWQLDSKLNPAAVAGVPPDNFALTGQLWGNPLYNYDLMEKDGYWWWIKRIEESLKLFDIVRIDHFRGFEAYYSIPFTDKTAEFGTWIKGPGYKLFAKVKEVLGDVNIIAEDLGFLTLEVYDLLAQCEFPGMKILQFGFNIHGDSEYAPHNYTKNSVVYPGTHDNSTLKGWLRSLKEDEYNYVKEYLQINHDDEAIEKAIKECLKSVCDTAIIPMQDYLELGDEARFNIPSTLGGNWVWRMRKDDLTVSLAEKIKKWAKIYRR